MQMAPKLGTGVGGIAILEPATFPSWSKFRPRMERLSEPGPVDGLAIGAMMYDVAGSAPKVDSVMSRTELPPDVTPWLSTCPGCSWNFAGPRARFGTCRNTFRA